MREIKFRYRFEERNTNKIITQVCTIGEIENRAFHPNPFGELSWGILSRDEYTGLKDKNGKEIYEGDRVRYWNQYHPFEATVTFMDGAFVFECTGGSFTCGIIWPENIDHDYLEIIGNIYENPNPPKR